MVTWVKKLFGHKEPELICNHIYVFKEQVWSRVGAKRFDLQDKFVCKECGDIHIQPII